LAQSRIRLTISSLSDRNDNLDISWLRDTSDDPEDEMTELEEIAAAIAGHLNTALAAINSSIEELENIG